MAQRSVTVALDVMGTDGGPAAMLAGMLLALAADPDLRVIAVGEELHLAEAFPSGPPPRVMVEVAEQTISMDEDPAVAIRKKRNSSTMKVMELSRRGEVDAVVTASNTGAVVLAAAAVLRRLPGVLHPALATAVTTGVAGSTLVDCGASARRDASWLVQYARFGVIAAETLFGYEYPPVGLLANGVEAMKGDDVLRRAHDRLQRSDLRYVGFVEPDALFARERHVLVTDGLTGNIVLKTVEATYRSILDQLVDPFVAAAPTASPGRGAVLLGVDGIVVKTHGVGSERGSAGGITLAAHAVRSSLRARLRDAMRPDGDNG